MWDRTDELYKGKRFFMISCDWIINILSNFLLRKWVSAHILNIHFLRSVKPIYFNFVEGNSHGNYVDFLSTV